MRNIKIIAFNIFILLVLSSCTSGSGEERNMGVLADSEIVASIRQEILDKQNSYLAADGDVFWTISGSSWHNNPTCSYLANSKTLYHGSIEEAKMNGKEKPCSRCASSGSSVNVYDQIADNPLLDGDVFFTEGGDIWHIYSDCSALEDGEPVYHGNEALAWALGKTSICSECENLK